jgi:hypothetical protein
MASSQSQHQSVLDPNQHFHEGPQVLILMNLQET